MKKPIKKGDKVIWNTGDIWCGPKDKGRWAIRNGDVRVVLDVSESGDKITLSNDTETGYFGWTDISNVEKVTFLIIMENFFFAVLCFIGLHQWKSIGGQTENYLQYFKDEYWISPTPLKINLAPPVRECRCCKIRQTLEVHCLGLKPPKFIFNWRITQ